jgi:hypothetical protein
MKKRKKEKKNQVGRFMSTWHDLFAKRVSRVGSGYLAHKRVSFGFRVTTWLGNCVGFGLEGQPKPDTLTCFATPSVDEQVEELKKSMPRSSKEELDDKENVALYRMIDVDEKVEEP